MSRSKKKSPEQLTECIKFRCTLKEKNRYRGLAMIYAKGNISRWLRHGGLTGERRHLK